MSLFSIRYIVVLFVVSSVLASSFYGCRNKYASEGDLDYDEQFITGTLYLNARDYQKAIGIFSRLHDQYPNDEVVTKYLAQSYASEAGIDMFVVIKDVYWIIDRPNPEESDLKRLETIYKKLPVLTAKTRDRLWKALITMEDYSREFEKESDKEFWADLLIYKFVYASCVVKYMITKINKERGNVPLEKMLLELMPYAVDVQYRIYSMWDNIFILPARFEEWVMKYLKNHKSKLRFDGQEYEIDYTDKSTIEKLLKDVIAHYMAEGEQIYVNIKKQIEDAINKEFVIELFDGFDEDDRAILRKNVDEIIEKIKAIDREKLVRDFLDEYIDDGLEGGPDKLTENYKKIKLNEFSKKLFYDSLLESDELKRHPDIYEKILDLAPAKDYL